MKPHGSFIRIALIAALVWVAVSLAAKKGPRQDGAPRDRRGGEEGGGVCVRQPEPR